WVLPCSARSTEWFSRSQVATAFRTEHKRFRLLVFSFRFWCDNLKPRNATKTQNRNRNKKPGTASCWFLVSGFWFWRPILHTNTKPETINQKQETVLLTSISETSKT